MEVAKIRLDTRELDRICRELDMNTDQVLRSISFQVEGEAKDKAPVDLGALKGSIKVEKKGKNKYWVQDGMDYGIYQELGFHHWKSGQFIQNAFMVPAVEKVRKYLADRFKGLFT